MMKLVPGMPELYRLDARKEGDTDCIVDSWTRKFSAKLEKAGFVPFGNNLPWKKDFVKVYKGKLVHLDIHIGGYECADNRVILASKMLEPERQIYLFFYKSIAKKNIAKYEKYIWQCWKKANKKVLSQHLETTFSNAQEILTGLQKGKLVTPQLNFSHQLRRVGCTIRNYTFKVLAFIQSTPTPYVAIIGTDGSGKTTAVQQVSKQFTDAGFSVRHILGGRFTFQVLPLNWLVKGIHKKKTGGKGGDTVTYKSTVLSYLVPLVYYKEYLLRYVFFVFPARRKNHVVLADRSFLDVAISPNTNTALSTALYSLLPKPKTIYVYNTLATIAKRRPTHPKKDLERQQKAYKQFQHNYATTIRTTTVQQTTKEIVQVILQ